MHFYCFILHESLNGPKYFVIFFGLLIFVNHYVITVL